MIFLFIDRDEEDKVLSVGILVIWTLLAWLFYLSHYILIATPVILDLCGWIESYRMRGFCTLIVTGRL